jgi:hypothetical protein
MDVYADCRQERLCYFHKSESSEFCELSTNSTEETAAESTGVSPFAIVNSLKTPGSEKGG